MKYIAFIFVSLVMVYDLMKTFKDIENNFIPAVIRGLALIGFAYSALAIF